MVKTPVWGDLFGYAYSFDRAGLLRIKVTMPPA